MMAEFCLECLRELDGEDYTERDFIISKDLDFCEGCGRMRYVVVVARRNVLWYDFQQMVKEWLSKIRK